jgi:hypothetical protein
MGKHFEGERRLGSRDDVTGAPVWEELEVADRATLHRLSPIAAAWRSCRIVDPSLLLELSWRRSPPQFMPP